MERKMAKEMMAKSAAKDSSGAAKAAGAELPGREMTGAEMVLEVLADQGVKHLFGYPGGAVLPIYDAIFQQKKVQHILVRHEQGAVHAARLCALDRQGRLRAGHVGAG